MNMVTVRFELNRFSIVESVFIVCPKHSPITITRVSVRVYGANSGRRIIRRNGFMIQVVDTNIK